VAKANGYDADVARIKAEAEEYKTSMAKYQSEAEARAKENEIHSLKLELMPIFTKAFKPDAVKDILNTAISEGIVGRVESGLVCKDGDTVEKWDTGFEKIKQRFSYAVETPPAGNGQGGVNRGSENNGQAKSLTELFA